MQEEVALYYLALFVVVVAGSPVWCGDVVLPHPSPILLISHSKADVSSVEGGRKRSCQKLVVGKERERGKESRG